MWIYICIYLYTKNLQIISLLSQSHLGSLLLEIAVNNRVFEHEVLVPALDVCE